MLETHNFETTVTIFTPFLESRNIAVVLFILLLSFITLLYFTVISFDFFNWQKYNNIYLTKNLYFFDHLPFLMGILTLDWGLTC